LPRFFARELPTEFQIDGATDADRLAVQPIGLPASSRTSRQLAAYMAVGVSTLCCVLVILLAPGSREQSTPQTAPSRETALSAPESDELTPVEEREHLEFSNIDESEKRESEETSSDAPLIPELEVEIFPLRPDQP